MQIGDCLGDMHNSNWSTLRAYLEANEEPFFIETQGLAKRIKKVHDFLQFGLPDSTAVLDLILSTRGLRRSCNKQVYLIGHTGDHWVAAYSYDGNRLGIAKIDLHEDAEPD